MGTCTCDFCTPATTSEPDAVAAFRASLRTEECASIEDDRNFARYINSQNFDLSGYKDLRTFLREVDEKGHALSQYETAALADYDRLMASRQTAAEHPDIATYRELLGIYSVPRSDQDARFVKAAMADERVRAALFDDTEDYEGFRDAVNGVMTYGCIDSEHTALEDYDAIVGNVKPIVDPVKQANAALEQAVLSMADTLDALAQEFRRIADAR